MNKMGDYEFEHDNDESESYINERKIDFLNKKISRQNKVIKEFYYYISRLYTYLEVDLKYIPTTIYVSDFNISSISKRMLITYLQETVKDFSILLIELPEENGSWRQKLIFKTRELMNKKEAQDTFEKINDGLVATYISKPQADVNNLQADGVAKLVQSLQNVDDAFICIGSLMLVKINDNGKIKIFSKTLNSSALKVYTENQDNFTPRQIFNWLQSADNHDNSIAKSNNLEDGKSIDEQNKE